MESEDYLIRDRAHITAEQTAYEWMETFSHFFDIRGWPQGWGVQNVL